MLNIQNILREILDIHESFNEEDFCDEGFKIQSCDLKITRSLLIVPDSKWNNQMLLNGYKLILKYSEEIKIVNPDFDINNITKPFGFEELNCTDKKILFEDNIFTLPIKLFSNDFECIKFKDEECFSFFITYNNIYLLTMLNEKGEIYISKEIKNKINIFLNNINYDKFCNYYKIKNENYSINLLPFQEVGTIYGILNKNIIIGDEMGLGKTIQALNIVSLNRSYPLIIVCPKSLKYKWLCETENLINVKVEVYNSKYTDFDKFDKDIYILTYDEISKIYHKLEWRKDIKSIIFDESHSLKNRKTLRSKACQKIKNTANNFIIETTGSPLLNKPSELINQIEMINRMDIFGSNIDFTNKYCLRELIFKKEDLCNFDYEKEKLAMFDLAQKMRENFYIRRLKKDTMSQLPDKRRTYLKVDIENKKEYDNLIKQYKNEKEVKKKKTLLSKIKEVAANGKLPYIIERINDYIENKEKVVVFAYHKNMQNKLIESFPNALRITAEQTSEERFENQNIFLQDDNQYLIICSIKVAYFGFDLYSASQMIFSELDWVPLINLQCEDRIHRIGQKNSVNIEYIIANNTIEEHILRVNNEKMKIIDKVNQNVPYEVSELYANNVKDEIMKFL